VATLSADFFEQIRKEVENGNGGVGRRTGGRGMDGNGWRGEGDGREWVGRGGG
jgi:hypothetical protein